MDSSSSRSEEGARMRACGVVEDEAEDEDEDEDEDGGVEVAVDDGDDIVCVCVCVGSPRVFVDVRG